MKYVIPLFWCVQLTAQSTIPDWGPVFLQEEVASVHITIDPDTLALLLDPVSWGNEHEFPATFQYESSVLDETVENIGFRLRGNTSLQAAKKSFKIDIDAFQDTSWQGITKLNLLGQHNDPSLLRNKLCWDTMRRFGLPGLRTSFVRLYINGEYRGLYLNAEHVDESFADARFDDGTGQLWKCLYPANLVNLGPDPEAYKLVLWTERVYDLKTNTFQDDYSALAEFITILNTTPQAELPCALERVFNAEDYMKYLALDVLTGNWDGYAFNNNNFYLYHNERTGQIEFIPYDLDNTLGIDWLNIDWANRPIYDWKPADQPRPLVENLLAHEKYRNLFTYYINSFADDWFHEDGIVAHARALQDLIADAAVEDTYRALDYGFEESDFTEAIDSAFGGHVDYGIAQYVEARVASLQLQTESWTEPVILNHASIESAAGLLEVRGTRSPGSAAVLAWRELPGGSWNATPASNLDLVAPWNEVAMIAVIDPSSPASSIEFNWVTAEEWSAQQNGGCPTRHYHQGFSAIPLAINECVSNGNSQVADASGEYADWIELYNTSSSDLFLGNLYITDRPRNWNRWKLPPLTLAPGAFLLLWADNDPEEGPDHLGFRLDGAGESVRISEVVNDAPRTIDLVAFPALPPGSSFGREADGTGSWVVFDTPTPGASNAPASVGSPEHAVAMAYPNPTTGTLHFSTQLSGSVWDAGGRKVLAFSPARTIQLDHLDRGIYFIRTTSGVFRIVLL